MAEAVEGDVFLDAGSLYPRFEIQCHCTVREIFGSSDKSCDFIIMQIEKS